MCLVRTLNGWTGALGRWARRRILKLRYCGFKYNVFPVRTPNGWTGASGAWARRRTPGYTVLDPGVRAGPLEYARMTSSVLTVRYH